MSTASNSSTHDRMPRWLSEWTKSVLVALALWLVLRTFVVESFRIDSGSMQNTLLVDDFLFVAKLYGTELPLTHTHVRGISTPPRGAIVVFRSVEGTFAVVKRLVGLPGDTLAMVHGQLYLNGQAVSEPYVIHTDSLRSETPEARAAMRAWQLPHLVRPNPTAYAPDVQEWGPLVVAPDSFFVMGDNRDDSYDSRYWGLLPRANLRGRPILTYYSYDPDSWRALPFLTATRWSRLFSRPR